MHPPIANSAERQCGHSPVYKDCSADWVFLYRTGGGRRVTAPVAVPQSGSAAPPQSIAVLPFANLSGDPQDEYFGDGLAEEITNVLAQMVGLKVLARTSAFAFKGKNDDIRGIAAALDVDNVLEGSVRRNGGQIRVTVQLIEAATGTHLSSKHYDGLMTDIFALQDEIAADVARQFRVGPGTSRRFTINTAACEAYLEGRFHWHKYAPGAFMKALACFEGAGAMDAACAPAWAGIAQCSLGLVTEAGFPALDYLPKAAEAARSALELDDSSGEAHALCGPSCGDALSRLGIGRAALPSGARFEPVPVRANHLFGVASLSFGTRQGSGARDRGIFSITGAVR
jgi:TolB-like protein